MFKSLRTLTLNQKKPDFSTFANGAAPFLVEKPGFCVRDDNLLFAALEFEQQEASTDTDEN